MPSLLQRAIHAIDPETAHVAAIRALSAAGATGTPPAARATALPPPAAGGV